MTYTSTDATRHPLFISLIRIAFFLSISLSFAAAFAASKVHKSMLDASNLKKSGQYTFSRCKSIQGKPFNQQSNKKKVLIIGDSMACDFINMVHENGFLQNYQIRLRFIPYRCQTVIGKQSSRYIAAKDRPYCANPARADTLERSKSQMHEADVVIFVSRWKIKIARHLPWVIKQMRKGNRNKVVVIGSKFFGKIDIRRYFRTPEKELHKIQNKVGTEASDINAILAKGLGRDIMFVDPHRIICGNKETCPVFTSDLQLISYDGRHLTKAGAKYSGRLLFQKSGLGKL